jgi:hypothetical protein
MLYTILTLQLHTSILIPALSAPTPTPVPVLVPAPTTAQEPIAPQPVVMTDYSTTPNEKTRKLFAKYGLTLDQGAHQSPTDLKLARVTKPIRMRVRRTCHRCETTFGADKVCINCSHTRCTKCPRSPPDRPNDKPQVRKPKISEISANQPRALQVTPHIKYTGNAASPLAMTSRTGGQDLVKKTVRQRTRRKCHLCTTQFVSGSKKCESCSHVRCKACPRDPAHLGKYPEGYPGDVDPPKVAPDRTFKKPRRRVHYLCHVCETSYLQGADTCSKCGQAKCAETIRIPYVLCLFYNDRAFCFC